MTSPIISWLPDSAIDALPTSAYWNNPEVERRKEWYVESTGDLKAIRYLSETTNLEEAFLAGIRFLEDRTGRKLRGICLDLGVGVCWTSAILAKKPHVERVYAVEMSRHRLLELAPITLQQYGAPAEKVTRVLGDFCDIKLDDGSVDAVVMAQTFHHAANVRRLLSEVARVLVPGGVVIVTGERPISITQFLRRALKHNLRGLVWALRLEGLVSLIRGGELQRPERLFAIRVETLFPADPVKGDRHRSLGQVRREFQNVGLLVQFQRLRCDSGKVQKATCNYIALKP